MAEQPVQFHEQCRLCGSEVKSQGRRPKHKTDCANLLIKALGVDVSHDRDDVHPPFVCLCCFLKLQRWKKRHDKYKEALPVNIELHSWVSTVSEQSTSTLRNEITACQKTIQIESKSLPRTYFQQYGNSIVLVELSKPGKQILKWAKISASGDWELELQGKQVNSRPDSVPSILKTEADALVFLNFFRTQLICPASDNIFTEEQLNHIKFDGYTVEDCFKGDGSMKRTVRHKSCTILSNDGKPCSSCEQFRPALFSRKSKEQAKTAAPSLVSSHTRNDLLSEKEKVEKLSEMRKKVVSLESQKEKLKKQISDIFNEESASFSAKDNKQIKEIFDKGRDQIQSLLAEDSPQKVLWEQQLENLKHPKNRWRWHPDVLKWCVAIFSKSSAAYNVIRQSGFLSLPSVVTINKYIHFTQATVGINPELLSFLVKEINAPLGSIQENISLILDEMKIKSELVFSSSSGKLIGFADTGDVNNLMDAFQRRIRGQTKAEEIPLASHVLVVMVRSIFGGAKFPLAYYATHELKGEDIYPIVWECIRALEHVNLHVRAIVCDGASQNRKFFNLHQDPGNQSITFYTENPYSPGEKIYFFCDAPHLLKTVRNNWENSGYNRKTRILRYKGKDIKWSHLLALQEWDQQRNAASPGLRFVHKLSHEHLHLTPALRMRVYLAAQVLSMTVANALESMQKEELSSTIHFIRMFDKWFDCLNVANVLQHKQQRNPKLAPYTTVDDDRLKWLEEEFLPFLNEWHAEAKAATDVPAEKRPRLFLSTETYTGLQITVLSFVSLTKELLELPDVEYILSEKFSQDPLEEYFSKQRGCGGRSENPTVQQFGNNVLSLMVAGSKAVNSVRGNCRKRPLENA